MRFVNYLILVVSVSLLGCDDIIVPDIAGKIPVILAPADSSAVATSTVTFRWEAVSGAQGYQLQIAQPTFATATRYLLDTVTSQTVFSRTIVPGTYQWRIRAVNSAYNGPYTTRILTVDSAGSISADELILSQPANGSLANAAIVTLKWLPIATAERYIVHVVPSPRSTSVAFDTVVYGISQLPLRVTAQDQQYQWSVTALNASGSSQSATYSFTVDTTAPGPPILTGPLDSATFSLGGAVDFSWTRGAIDVERDSLFLYLANQTTKLGSFPRSISSSSFSWITSDTSLHVGTYFWAVKSVDRAGNVSALSAKQPLRLQ